MVVRPRLDLGDRKAPHLALAVDGKQPPSNLWPTATGSVGAANDDAGPPAPRSPAVEVGVHHDNVEGRVRGIDQLGVGVQVLNAGSTVAAARWLPSNLAAGILGAFNRFALAYAASAPGRLRTVVQLHGGEPEWSAAELRELAGERCVAAATIWLPGVAPDDPRFAPIWQVLDETGVPLLHRPEACSPIWTPQRLLAVLGFAGILGKYPGIRVIFGQSGTAWLDPWLQRVVDVTQDSDGGRDVRQGISESRLFVCTAPDDDPAEGAIAAAQLGSAQVLWESGFPYRVPTPLGPSTEDSRTAWAANGAVLIGGEVTVPVASSGAENKSHQPARP